MRPIIFIVTDQKDGGGVEFSRHELWARFNKARWKRKGTITVRMPEAGLEPARGNPHKILSLACLPIPSLRRWRPLQANDSYTPKAARGQLLAPIRNKFLGNNRDTKITREVPTWDYILAAKVFGLRDYLQPSRSSDHNRSHDRCDTRCWRGDINGCWARLRSWGC